MNEKEREVFSMTHELNNSLMESHQTDIHNDKIAIVGGSKVGKTSLANKFLIDYFPDTTTTITNTTSNDIIENHFKIISFGLNKSKVSIIDQLSIPKCEAYLLLFSINSKKSLDNLKSIRDKLFTLNGRHHKYILVGNKKDLEYEREISLEYAQNLARVWGIPYFEISTKFDMNNEIDLIFQKLIMQLHTEGENKRWTEYLEIEAVAAKHETSIIKLLRISSAFFLLIGLFNLVILSLSFSYDVMNFNAEAKSIVFFFTILSFFQGGVGITIKNANNSVKMMIFLMADIMNLFINIGAIIIFWAFLARNKSVEFLRIAPLIFNCVSFILELFVMFSSLLLLQKYMRSQERNLIRSISSEEE